jgi:hypothetical protein
VQNFFHHLIHGVFPTDRLYGSIHAGIGAKRTAQAIPLPQSAIGKYAVRIVLGTCLFARITMNALHFMKQPFRSCMLRFGIVAPGAAQRASFQENRRAYSRAVMGTEMLDIKNTPRHRCYFQK